jgi:hypothetical protein
MIGEGNTCSLSLHTIPYIRGDTADTIASKLLSGTSYTSNRPLFRDMKSCDTSMCCLI